MYPSHLKPLPRKLLHGADYNPEQWPRETWKEDVRLMKIAGVNAISIGMFSWSALETADGLYEFGWLDEVLDLLHRAGINVLLATPSAAMPPWLARQYPEALRTDESGRRSLFRGRQNHCLTSPDYRRKVKQINHELASRYAHHSAVILWHISNEYLGKCYCPLCADAFRKWLQQRYGSIDALNAQWWATFWSHRYTDWAEIDPPSPSIGEQAVHGLELAWRNFSSDQTIDFMREEIAAVRPFNPVLPVSTNMFHFYNGLDYFRFAREVDVIMWDSYPFWHRDKASDAREASLTAMEHDMMRSMRGGQPFLMIESVPSAPNWQPVNKLKRPGMALLSALQAVAHGSDAVMYFQWRKSRGAFEKFHGAVLDHSGRDDTRVFNDVVETGEALSELEAVAGGLVPAEVAVVFDWNNRWAIDVYSGLRADRDYVGEVAAAYRALWRRSVSCDVVDQTCALHAYKLVVIPFAYSLRPGFAQKVEEFVQGGGCVVFTHAAGTVDQDDLVFEGGQPGPLRKLLGLWVEETDALYDNEHVRVVPGQNSPLTREYVALRTCERLRVETAVPLAHYGSEFYTGEPCVTVNAFGSGRAYYLGCEAEEGLLGDLVAHLLFDLEIASNWPSPLSEGVHAQCRKSGEDIWCFLMNFNAHPEIVSADIELPAYGVKVLKNGL